MARTQLDSNTYGIGELITQRKLLEVPTHQRDYSWTDLQITQYLQDVNSAFDAYQSDYFIGLVVLQGPVGGIWRVLDGQQRLATTTMIYSAIRVWLTEHGLIEDGKQIEIEYLGVRQLGGNFSSRLKLNETNRTVFDDYIVRFRTADEIKAEARKHARNGSNKSLLDGALLIREWIVDFCKRSEGDIAAKARRLFELATYIETRVQVVCVDVAEDFDPYILFESLNDRGAELTALDLVKNYVFGAVDIQDEPSLRRHWERMSRLIEGRNADDFLKVFWTSHFGVVQKSDLYRKIRNTYPGSYGALSLASELEHAAQTLSLIENTKDEFWRAYTPEVIDYLKQLELIGSKLVRPVLLAGMRRFSPTDFPLLLWSLIVLLVRYQMVAKGRTGVLEKILGALANGIDSGKVQSEADIVALIKPILPEDSAFIAQVAEHIDAKLNRMIYLLAGADMHYANSGSGRPRFIYEHTQAVGFVHYIRRVFAKDIEDNDGFRLLTIGNLLLVEAGLAKQAEFISQDELKRSTFSTTKAFAEGFDESAQALDARYIHARSLKLAEYVAKVWRL